MPLRGVCAHTTGVGPLKKTDPLDHVLRFYASDPNPFAHYVIDHAGTIVSVADEGTRAWHAGIERKDRARYLAGTWARGVTSAVRDAWRSDFPVWGDPVSMVPGGDPNEVYVGIEMIPRSDRRFFPAQYDALSRLVWDIWTRYAMPTYTQWSGPPELGYWAQMRRQGRLVGHEDLEPLARTTRHGGYDPGYLGRSDPLFSWSQLFHLLEQLAEADQPSG